MQRCARNAALLLAKAVLRDSKCKDVLVTLRFYSQKPFYVTAFAATGIRQRYEVTVFATQ
ncbi:hypothetical protein [Sporosarcina sp. ACRSL]|uniref:hypothetical protein n=1 Tax=Sporosarcina sp. ACRSL TaxID=2918215 RepID=UPI001EF5B606|nr:hypothetical protein [Sporosarcina sp. ACRSL]